MIITKTPLRLSLGGGGSDRPECYEKFGGSWVSGAINYYVYVVVKSRIERPVKLSYSAQEEVRKLSEIRHPIIREALKKFKIIRNLEVVTLADLPAGSGLGSSGSFTVGLLHALHQYVDIEYELVQRNLAEEAYLVERNKLDRKIGKQDQYASAVGGLNHFTAGIDGAVTWDPIDLTTTNKFCPHLVLASSPLSHNSYQLLRTQNDPNVLAELKSVGDASFQAIKNMDIRLYSDLMNEQWSAKRRFTGVSNQKIDDFVEYGLKHGADGAKLVGAGGGGFLLFCCVDIEKVPELVKKMNGSGLKVVRFDFDQQGTRMVTI